MSFLRPGEISQKIKHDLRVQKYQAKKHWKHYLFMLPYLLLFTTFIILPVIIAICISFTSFNIMESPQWIGIQNYVNLFVNDELFIKSIVNTIMFAVVIGPGGYLLSLLLAWLLNDLTRGLRVFFTIIFYAPSITGGMTIIWGFLFSGDMQGLINSTLYRFGLITTPIQFFQDTAYIVPLLMVIMLWMSLGTSFLSFIAGLQGVDKQYYEAAAIDGIRNRWQELWFVTLPLMKPQLMFGAVMSITSAFSCGAMFDAIAGFPTVDYVAHTMINHMNDFGLARYEMGYASAIATLLFLMMIGTNKLIQFVLNRVGS